MSNHQKCDYSGSVPKSIRNMMLRIDSYLETLYIELKWLESIFQVLYESALLISYESLLFNDEMLEINFCI